ncbi:MAG TPA: NADH:flavin oxidoreductase [Blastocatellia bacterium]|nr:NADH:flavin oxidoreductase [Blastocatellia bacterium]
MGDKDKTQKTTRRQFIELAAAGSVSVTAAGLGVGSAVTRAAPRPAGRSHYKIFSPGRLGKMKLKNRIVRSAAFEGGGTPTGEVSDEMIRFHRAYAEGGVGLTITGYMAVMEYGKKVTHVCAYDDRFIPGLKKLADAVHGVGNDCKLAAEIGHDGTSVAADRAGRRGEARMLSPTGLKWPGRIGPSGINWRGEPEGHVMTEAEILRFCSDMGHATRRLREAGFDAVEIHGAHHYLINTFLSPYTNRRTDRWGGSLKNRVRIVAEMVKRMREHVGRDFPIIIKLNCDDGPTDNGTPGEIDIHSFPALVREIVGAGVDAIDISGSERPGDPLRMGIGDPKDQSFYLRYAEAMDVDAAVILGCGNRNVELLEGIIKRGKVDFFCFARPMVREPDLAKRWLEGRGSAASECINSNLCFRRLLETGSPVRCVVLEEMHKTSRALSMAGTSTCGA